MKDKDINDISIDDDILNRDIPQSIKNSILAIDKTKIKEIKDDKMITK